MNENTRTAMFLVAAVLVAGATVAIPLLRTTETRLGYDASLADLEGTLLFPEFTDPLAAASLEVIRYDEQTGDRTQFEVAQVEGIWSIPSHENYPADAKEHLAAAAASLIDLKIVGVAGTNPVDHGLFGVIDPTDKNLRPGTPGVGMKVVMKGEKDKTLVSMIVGKEVAESQGLRYVRRAGQDAVLTVKLSTSELSTDFGDWIEKDLLKFNAWDLREIFIQDYSIDEVQGHVLLSDEFTLGYNGSADPKWKLLANRAFNKHSQWEDVKLSPDEELNTERLDAMQTALDDLKIVDVARKPTGLSADLAADKTFMDDPEAVASLMQRGFYPAKVEDKMGIYSNEGEIRVLMKDGVEYILRFGGIAGSDGGSKRAKDDPKKDKDAEGEGVNRYLFVMAEFNPAPIEKPQLQPLPAESPKKETAGDQAEEGKSAEKKTEPAAEPSEKADAKEPETAADAEKKSDADTKAALEEERKRIEKENQREQEEHDEKIAEGKKKVAELNARFANWYYVISESVYDKIHLGRGEIIKKKDKDGKKTGAGSSKLPVPDDSLPPDAFKPLRPESQPADPEP